MDVDIQVERKNKRAAATSSEPKKVKYDNANVSTSNKFGALASIGSKSVQQRTLYRAAPITVPNMTSETIRAHLVAANIKDFSLKNKSIGVSVNVSSKEDYDVLLKSLDKGQVGFYSHPGKEDRMSKFVCSGLSKMDIATLKMELSELNVHPTQVYAISPRNVRYTDDTMYLMHFKVGTIKLSDLQKIRALNHTIVKWDHYKQIKRGPTQCRNCQMYGHGTNFCHLPTKCMKCGKDHSTDECDKAAESVMVCANCSKNHAANSIECESRTKYITIRNSMNHRNVIRSQPEPNRRRYVDAPAPPQPTKSYSSWFKTSSMTNEAASNAKPNDIPLTPDEIVAIIGELSALIGTGISRAEQVAAVCKITMKYVCK